MVRRRVGATILALCLGLAQAGCTVLPRGGPMTAAMATAADDGLEGLVAPLTAEVAERTKGAPRVGLPEPLLRTREIDPTRLGIDDVLDISVWETQDTGLFGSGTGASRIEAVTVDPAGRIFIPFAGSIRAAGSTPGELRERVRAALEPLTLSPQVDVRLREPRSRTVTIQGRVAQPGAYTIERAFARLTPMLALAGGATIPPEQAEVTLRRGSLTGAVLLEDLYADPTLNIALAPGDIVVVNAIRERFVVLGATRVQGEISFPTRELSLLRALGAARGLIDNDADPSGVFVLRWEDPALATALLPGAVPEGAPLGPGRPIVYQLDMSTPEALFVAQRFRMRDGDAIFVSNAPLTELRKVLQLFTLLLNPIQQTNQLVP